jgi:alginate O-acetyltransferase complex protein AlgI
MNFNTPNFLFLFLPACLILYFLANPRWRLWIGLAASLIFYAWGQLFNLPILLTLILVNYLIGLKVMADRGRKKHFSWVKVGIAFDLLLLIFYKYLATYGYFLPAGLSFPLFLTKLIGNPQFPVGLSYITFQVISYLVDIQREMSDGEKDFFTFAWYILMFPKILSGPITRYTEIREELRNPQVNAENINYGIRRFTQGLAKKVLIADTLANLVNPVFSMPSPNIPPNLAWLVLFAFSLQLYFDFSGIVDMAIGMGRMLGFHFVENFNYPYISRSITEFWRRWHISLSSWFRDYVFYPLEFNHSFRLGQWVNIIIVFLLTGLWHGINPPFIIWGLINGMAVSFESTRVGKRLDKIWRPLQHLYALAVMLVGWVFFRSSTLSFAVAFLGRLAGDASGLTPLSFAISRPLPIIEPSIWIALCFGLFFCLPVVPFLQRKITAGLASYPRLSFSLTVAADGVRLIVLIFSIAMIASGSYAPGLYGRF